MKHCARVEAGYVGDCFDRPFPLPLPLRGRPGANTDMWAPPDQTRASVLELAFAAAVHGDATIEALPLDSVGRVPWWAPGRQEVTLHQVLVHLVAELHRHAGHAGVLRELVAGSAGLRAGAATNLPEVDWAVHRARLEQAARQA